MGSRGASNNGGVGGVAMIPTGSRKIVDSLKEIVRNHPESEIYAALKECNMDPNEAVNRLLSQDPFHEVKSKRDKRKENTTESRPRGGSNSSRGGKGGADRYASRGGSDFISHGKSTSAYKENGFTTTKSTKNAGSVTTRRLPTINDAVDTEKKKTVAVAVDDVSAARQHSSGHQPAWGGVPGQMSMADIVKMGKPHSKVPNVPSEPWPQVNASYNYAHGSSSSGALDDNWQLPDDHTSKASELPCAQHDSTNDDWPVIEKPSTVNDSSILDPPSSQLHPDSSNSTFDITNQHPQLDEVPEAEDDGIDSVQPAGASPVVEDNSGGASSPYESDLDRYQPLNQGFDGNEVEDGDTSVSLAAANMQQLSMQEEQGLSPERDGPSVVIPEHLQVQAADCLHLSFGSFGSPPGDLASPPAAEAHVEETSIDVDAPPAGHLTNGSSEYYGDEDLRNAPDEILFHRTGAVSGNYESPSESQSDSLKVEHSEVAHGNNQYSFPSSTPGYTYENAQPTNVEFSQSQASSHTQNLASFTGYTNSLPSNLLTANVHAGRESEHSFSPFSTQAMPTKYGSSSISTAEALKSVGFSSTHPTQQTLNGPALHQHVAVHPYSQPTLPVGPFANIISYPFLPQSYTYMPPGFQQQFPGNTTYQQSLAALYKNSVSVNSLPHSSGVAPSGYGAIHGSFPLNPSAAPGTSLGIDDGLGSRYKDNNQLLSLQQGENSGMWLHGHGSRTMPGAPANTYYSIQGQNQQGGGGFRQVQQPTQSHGSLGYPNFYHSQGGMALDHHHHHHHQQIGRDGSLVGGQVQAKPSSSSQQLWQNGY